jgi:hypothetical protein
MPGAISGTLYYYDTGAPIDDIPGHAGDRVRAFGPVEAAVSPDYTTGTYKILNLPSDTYQVEAELHGFSTGIAPQVPLAEGGTTRQDFSLSFAGGISGTVLDMQTGAPLLGAQVVATQTREPYVGFGAALSAPTSGTVLLDDQEAVDAFGRQFTRFDVVAEAPGHSSALHSNVEVVPKGTTSLVFWLDLPASFAFAVHDHAGSPIEGAAVSLAQLGGVGAGLVLGEETDASGGVSFTSCQAPANYRADVYPDFAHANVSRQYSVSVGDAVQDTFVVPLLARITGAVVDSSTGQPIADAAVYVLGPNDEVERTAYSDANGGFAVYGLYWPATFSVQALAEEYSPASADVTVTSDDEFQSPDLSLQPGPYLLRDTFTDADGTALDAHIMEVGPGWTEYGGEWEIESNRAQNASGTGWISAAADALEADTTEKAVVNMGAGAEAGLCGRLSDEDNAWFVVLREATDELAIIEDNAGTATTRATGEVSVSSGVEYLLKVVFTGHTIIAYVDDVEIARYESATHNAQATRFGLVTFDAPGDTTFDDFRALA